MKMVDGICTTNVKPVKKKDELITAQFAKGAAKMHYMQSQLEHTVQLVNKLEDRVVPLESQIRIIREDLIIAVLAIEKLVKIVEAKRK